MNQDINLEKIEKKVYMAYHQDGLWDIALGIAFLVMGLVILFDKAVFGIILFPIFIPLGMSFKKSITLPRLGYAKFSPQRQKKEQKAKARMAILFTFTFLAGLVAFWGYMGGSDLQQLIRDLKLIPFGAVLALSAGVIGALLSIWRLIMYGVIILTLFIAGHFLQSDPSAYMIAIGVIILICGIIMMIRFMKKYPKPPQDEFSHEFK